MVVIYTNKQVPEREKDDHYPTPYPVAFHSMQLLRKLYGYAWHEFIDPGAGGGNWGVAARNTFRVTSSIGIELRTINEPVGGYTEWHSGTDFLDFKGEYDWGETCIIGNPPFKLAGEFIEHSYDLLGGEGIIAFLLPSDFLFTKKRYHKLFTKYHLAYMCPYVNRIPFTGPGNTNNYDFYIFDTVYNVGEEPKIIWINQDDGTILKNGKIVKL